MMSMKHRVTSVSALAALGLAVGLALGFAPAPRLQTEKSSAPAAGSSSLAIDAVHSSVFFKVKHVGAANFYGRFNDVGGKVSFDEKAGASLAMEVQVKTDSLDTNNVKRDAHIKGPEFFDVEKFPTLSFKSTGSKKTGEHAFDVTGDISFHGVKKTVTVPVTHTGTSDVFGHRVGFETTFTIKRSDYGVGAYVEQGTLGDEVTFTVALEATEPEDDKK